jgi:hypothetical protein
MVALDPTKPCQAIVSPCTINPMRIVDVIADAWGWKGVCPSALVLQNAFGNLIFLDEHGQYWRICPEELSCEIVATNEEHFAKLQNTSEFIEDWTMRELVERAQSAFGLLHPDRCYCLKIPAVLGGAYTLANIGTIDRAELISFSGDVAKQVKDLPDGAQVRFRITD